MSIILFVLLGLWISSSTGIRTEEDLQLFLDRSRHGPRGTWGLEDFDQQGRALLVEAAKYGRFDVVEAIVASKKARLSLRDKAAGVTALIAAIRGGHYAIAELLIEAGADLNTPDRDDTTPVMAAAAMGASHLVEIFVKKGVDVSIVDKTGYNVLMYAAASGSEEIVRLLLDIKSQTLGVNQKSKREGKTALLLAASHAMWKTAKIFIEHGVSLDDQIEGDGYAAIHLAAGQGNEATTKLLIEYGAEINTFTKHFDQSPLYLAVKSGHIGTVTALLAAGADPNHTSTDLDHTPLMAAAVMDNQDLVAALLKGRADPTFVVKHCDRLDKTRCSEYTASRLVTTIGRTHASIASLLRLAEKEWSLSHKGA